MSPSLETLVRIALALGGDLGLRFLPGAGVPIRDRFQARMIEALLAILHPRWKRLPEVPVMRPVFAWNHRVVMGWGYDGFVQRLKDTA